MTSYPPPPRRVADLPDLSTSRGTSAAPTPPALPSRQPDAGQADSTDDDDDGLDVISYWAIGTAVWLGILALPLLLFPRLLVFLSQSSTSSLSELSASNTKTGPAAQHYDDLTPLEGYLCTQLGIGIVAVIGMTALLIPTPPPPPFPSLSPTSLPTPLPSNLRQPFLLILCSLLALSGLISYNTPSLGGGLAALVGIGNGVVGVWGWWVAVFGGGSYRSRKTGADKRTSRFPFYNTSAASVRKKEWKKAHRE